MKKYRFIFASVVLVGLSFWSLSQTHAQVSGGNMLLNGNNIFEENDGIQPMSTIEINDFTGGLLTASKGLTLFFPDQRSFRWDKSTTQITARGSAVVNGRMADTITVTYNKNLRYLSIPVLQDFQAGEYVILSGLKLRIYNQQINSQAFHLDYTGDGTEDVTIAAGIKVILMDAAQPNLKRSDRMAPVDLTGLVATPNIQTNTIRLNWDPPVDPDATIFNFARYLVASDLTEALDHSWVVNDASATQPTETTDTTPVKQKTYRYEVTVSDGLNTGPPASVTIAYAVPEPTTIAPTTLAPEIPTTTAPPSTTAIPSTTATSTTEIPSTTAQPVTELFTDVPESHWAAESVATLANKGIVRGKSNNVYDLNAQATRAEFAKMIIRALDLPIVLSISEDPFPDAPKSEWYAPYFAVAKNQGLIKGDNGNANPGRPITRAEAVVILVRAMNTIMPVEQAEESATTFIDIASTDWFYSAVVTAKEQGLVTGTDATHFSPHKNINRAELAVLVHRLMEWMEEEVEG